MAVQRASKRQSSIENWPQLGVPRELRKWLAGGGPSLVSGLNWCHLRPTSAHSPLQDAHVGLDPKRVDQRNGCSSVG